ncbi:MAG: protoporphyrinogen oxidase [Alicyclobacillus sp.]|nr:protoporphyrinogen oxidase [Alicyclobacillus sp.]
MSERVVAVIGGGITGLAAAFALQQAAGQSGGLRCVVLEQSERWGGKIRTDREDGLVMEFGPDSLLARKPAGMELIRQLGLESEVVHMNPSAGRTYMLYRGQLVDMPQPTHMGVPASLRAIWNTPLVSERGKLRAMLDLALPRTTVPEVDHSLGAMLRRRLGDEWVTQVCEPLMAGISASKLDDLSALSTFPQFAAMEQRDRSLIIGAHRLRGAAAPGTAGQRSAFITLKGGLQSLVEQLYHQLHDWAELRTATSVQHLGRRAGGYELTLGTTAGPERLLADAVIVTVPAYAAGQLLCPLSDKAASLSAIRYVSTATVVLGYPPDALAGRTGSGFLVPRTESVTITASTWTSNKWPHTVGDDRVLIRCYVGRSGQQESLQLDDATLASTVAEELQEVVGLQARPWFSRVARWERAMPQFEVGHRNLVADVETHLATDAPGVYLAGAGFHGIGIPDCIESGRRAAERVLTFLQGA